MDGWMDGWMDASSSSPSRTLFGLHWIYTYIHTFIHTVYIKIKMSTSEIQPIQSEGWWKVKLNGDLHGSTIRIYIFYLVYGIYVYSVYIHIYHDMMVILWWRSCIRSCRQTEEMWDLLLTHVKGGFICSNECVYILIYEFNTYGSLRRKTFDSRISYSMLHIFLLFYKVKRVSTKNFSISILLKNLIFLYLKLLRISKFTNRILFTYLLLYSNPC